MVSHVGPPHYAVVRDGQPVLVNGGMPKPGDVALMEAGNNVPADLRIGEAPARVEERAAPMACTRQF